MRITIAMILLGATGLLPLAGCHIFQHSGSGANTSARPSAAAPTATAANENQQGRLDQAAAAQDRGDYDAALTLLQDILAENPTITPAYLAMGEIHLIRDNFTEAEAAYRRATRLEPRSYTAQFGHGRALQSLRRFAEAVEAYLRALTINPNSVPANLNVANSYLSLGNTRLAQPFAEKAVQLDPGNGEARITLANVYDELEMYPRAIETYRVALELVDPTPEIILNLVNALSNADRFREAIDAAETLNRMQPNANAYERMGRAFFRLREYDKSVEAYRRAVGVDPELWVAWNGIGVNMLNEWLLSKRQDRTLAQHARDAFRASLRINPDQPKIVQLLSNYQL